MPRSRFSIRLVPPGSCRQVWRTWHVFSITWGLFVLEPWEAAVVLALLLSPPALLLWRMLGPA